MAIISSFCVHSRCGLDDAVAAMAAVVEGGNAVHAHQRVPDYAGFKGLFCYLLLKFSTASKL